MLIEFVRDNGDMPFKVHFQSVSGLEFELHNLKPGCRLRISGRAIPTLSGTPVTECKVGEVYDSWRLLELSADDLPEVKATAPA